MAFRVMDPKALFAAQRSQDRRGRTQRQHPLEVAISRSGNHGASRFVLGHGLRGVFGPVPVDVAVLFDADRRQLLLRRPSVGEPTFRIYAAGSKKQNLSIPAPTILRHIGAAVDFRGILATEIRGDGIVVDLEPLFAKGA